VLFGGLAVAVATAGAGARLPRAALAGLAAAGVLAVLAGPLAYTLNTVATAATGPTPSAGPLAVGGGGGGLRGGGFGGPPGGGGAAPGGGPGGGGAAFGSGNVSTALAALLERNATGYTWVAATDSSNS